MGLHFMKDNENIDEFIEELNKVWAEQIRDSIDKTITRQLLYMQKDRLNEAGVVVKEENE